MIEGRRRENRATDQRRYRMVGGSGWSGLAPRVDRRSAMPASGIGLRDTLLPISGTDALATTSPRGGTAGTTYAGPSHVPGVTDAEGVAIIPKPAFPRAALSNSSLGVCLWVGSQKLKKIL